MILECHEICRSLHSDRIRHLHYAINHIILVVHPLGSLLSGRDGTHVLLDQRLHGIHIHITHYHQAEAGGIGEELPVIPGIGSHRSLFEQLHVDEPVTGIVVVESLLQALLHLELGIAHYAGEDALKLSHAHHILFLIETRLDVVHIHELEGGLEILLGRSSADSVVEPLDERGDLHGLAREHLLCLRAGELSYATVGGVE